MFARSVSIRVKPNSVAEFNKTLENKILPLLQKQKGFKDELTLVAPNGSEVLAISLWNRKEDAEAYQRATYPEVQKLLSEVIDGTPQVQTYEVSTSTIHKVAAHRGVSA
jgi:heme-degrading monooxygenase HmoA